MGVLVWVALMAGDFVWEPAPEVVVVLATARGPVGDIAGSGLFAAADGVFRADTNVVPVTIEQACPQREALAACGAQGVACWSSAMTPLADGGPALVLVVETHPGDGASDRMVAQLFDRQAGALVDEVLSEDVDAASGEALELYFRHVTAALLRAPRWDGRYAAPYGTLRFAALEAGSAIEVDGRTLGLAEGGAVEIRNLRPGAHAVAVMPPTRSRAPFEGSVHIEAGVATDLVIELVAPSTLPRDITTWTGVSLAVAGAAVLVAAAVTGESSRAHALCFVAPCPEVSADGFVGFDDESARIGLSGAGRAGGPRMVPLGLSLTLGGAVAAVGARVETAEDATAVPWWSLVGGVVVGSLALAITSLP